METEHMIDMTDKEIFVLLGLMEATRVVGMSNPFANLSDDETKNDWESVILGLKERKLIGKDENEEFWIDEVMMTALSVMAYTDIIIQVDEPDEKPSISVFYFADDFVIECEELDNHIFRIWHRANSNQTIENVIFPKTGFENKSISKSGSMLLPGRFINDWNEKRSDLNDFDNTIQRINENQMPILWRQLKRSLNRKDRIKRLMMYYFTRDAWKVEGLCTIFSPSNNWVLRMIDRNGEELLQAKQVDLLDISKEYVAVLERCLKDTDHITAK